MAECDANYIRLLKLVPQLQAYRDKSFIEYALLDSVNSSLTRTNQSLQTNEPEKVLEGLASEFFIY